jgi:hypothetical protein
MKGANMLQFLITPAAGKRLIAKAMLQHPAIKSALKEGTLAIVAGTTNGYVAEEILNTLGAAAGFSRQRFFRGIAAPPGTAAGDGGFPGDVIISKGQWQTGKTIFDVVDELQEGDVILKGANAVDLQRKQAGVLIGHPQGGTIVRSLQAVVGRRVRLILPVGLEKRVASGLNELAAILNAPGAKGARLLPVPGEIVTEIEALALLADVQADLVAAGGVCGAEGAVWLAVRGSKANLEKAAKIVAEVAGEPRFEL